MMNGDAAAVRSSFCLLVVVAAAALVQAGPVSLYSAMSPFGRNIRPIACKSKAGDEGVCMFAMDCTRMNGIHLGTCIDRFYFGSCCAPTSPLQAAEFGIVPSNGISDLSTPTTTTTTTTTPSVISSTTGINLNVPNEILTTIISLQPAVTTGSSTTAATFLPSTTGLPPVTSTATTTSSTPGTSASPIPSTLAPPPSPTTQSSSSSSSTTVTSSSSTTAVPSTTTTTTVPASTSTPTTTEAPSTTTTPLASSTSTGASAAATATSTNAPLTTTTPQPQQQQVVELIVPTTDTPSSSVELESITTIEPFLPTDADSSTESGVELTTAQSEEESLETTEDTTEAVKQEATVTVSSPSVELVTPSTTGSSSTTVSPSSSTALPSSLSSSSVTGDVTTAAGTSTTTSEPSVPSVELTTVDAGLITTITTSGNNETTEEGTPVTVPQNPDYRQVCGRPQYRYPTARIVGGTTTQYGQWPWQISLRQWRTATFLHKCGAALLNENWAITAAHCVDNVQPDDLLLRMGEYDLATDEEEYPYVERKVQIVASHPQFDSRTFEYDLALLRFYDPVRFQPNIVPICLPSAQPETDYVGQTAYVTGWGRLYEDGPLPSKMQQVSVPVINNTECENMYRRAGYVEHIPNIFICAGYAEGKRDSCEGDSGGPMVIHGNNTDHWVLAGVISWGIGCAEANQPGVYTRISEFREWIDKIIVF